MVNIDCNKIIIDMISRVIYIFLAIVLVSP